MHSKTKWCTIAAQTNITAVGILALFFYASTAAPAYEPTRPGAHESSTRATPGLRVTISSPKSQYRSGQPVEVKVNSLNTSRKRIDLYFATWGGDIQGVTGPCTPQISDPKGTFNAMPETLPVHVADSHWCCVPLFRTCTYSFKITLAHENLTAGRYRFQLVYCGVAEMGGSDKNDMPPRFDAHQAFHGKVTSNSLRITILSREPK